MGLGYLRGGHPRGDGIAQDYGEAMGWYRKAAGQGFARAQYNLGVMYGKGRGVPRDDVQAYMWFTLSASGSSPGKARDKAARNRDVVAAQMTPAQIAEARKLARAWKPEKK